MFTYILAWILKVLSHAELMPYADTVYCSILIVNILLWLKSRVDVDMKCMWYVHRVKCTWYVHCVKCTWYVHRVKCLWYMCGVVGCVCSADRRNVSSSPVTDDQGLLPVPIHVGKYLREKRIDFKLPYDVWWLHSSGVVGRSYICTLHVIYLYVFATSTTVTFISVNPAYPVSFQFCPSTRYWIKPCGMRYFKGQMAFLSPN